MGDVGEFVHEEGAEGAGGKGGEEGVADDQVVAAEGSGRRDGGVEIQGGEADGVYGRGAYGGGGFADPGVEEGPVGFREVEEDAVVVAGGGEDAAVGHDAPDQVEEEKEAEADVGARRGEEYRDEPADEGEQEEGRQRAFGEEEGEAEAVAAGIRAEEGFGAFVGLPFLEGDHGGRSEVDCARKRGKCNGGVGGGGREEPRRFRRGAGQRGWEGGRQRTGLHPEPRGGG